MTKFCIDDLKQHACSASPNHGLTPLDIQRWEDDGGAILAEPAPWSRRAHRHRHDEMPQMAAAD